MFIYKETDGLKYIMEQRLAQGAEGQFPKTKKNLIQNFRDLEAYLNEKYHPNVNLGAAISGDGILTDHGVDHVQMVMDKAFSIINGKENSLRKH